MSFVDLYCDKFDCSPEKFEESVFRQCLYPHAVQLVSIISGLNPRYFNADLELIRQVKFLNKADEVSLEIQRFRYHDKRTGGLRRWLKARVSGRRLLTLARSLFAPAARTQPLRSPMAKRGTPPENLICPS
jgi:hypothetical protein